MTCCGVAAAQLFEMLKKEAVAVALVETAGPKIERLKAVDKLVNGQLLRLVQSLELFAFS